MPPSIGCLARVDPQVASSIVEIADYPIKNLARSQAHRQRQQCTNGERMPRLFVITKGSACETPRLFDTKLGLARVHFADRVYIPEGRCPHVTPTRRPAVETLGQP